MWFYLIIIYIIQFIYICLGGVIVLPKFIDEILLVIFDDVFVRGGKNGGGCLCNIRRLNYYDDFNLFFFAKVNNY